MFVYCLFVYQSRAPWEDHSIRVTGIGCYTTSHMCSLRHSGGLLGCSSNVIHGTLPLLLMRWAFWDLCLRFSMCVVANPSSLPTSNPILSCIYWSIVVMKDYLIYSRYLSRIVCKLGSVKESPAQPSPLTSTRLRSQLVWSDEAQDHCAGWEYSGAQRAAKD